jgi:ribosome-binding protein aMBF1 (putative translation factor)
MKCNRCGSEISQNESYDYFGEILCEDCYIDARYPAKACDPWAVYSATRTRESSGQQGTEGLTELQKSIYEIVKSKGKVTGEEIIANLGISQHDLESQFAILRHCELIKGRKDGSKVYIVPFDYEDE